MAPNSQAQNFCGLLSELVDDPRGRSGKRVRRERSPVCRRRGIRPPRILEDHPENSLHILLDSSYLIRYNAVEFYRRSPYSTPVPNPERHDSVPNRECDGIASWRRSLWRRGRLIEWNYYFDGSSYAYAAHPPRSASRPADDASDRPACRGLGEGGPARRSHASSREVRRSPSEGGRVKSRRAIRP